MPAAFDLPQDLVGDAAAKWFLRRKWGGTLLDDGLIAVSAHFGAETEIGAWVPAHPETGKYGDFYLQVKGRIERKRDWERIVSVYEELDLARERRPDEGFHRAQRRFHPVLARSPVAATSPAEVASAWYGP